jgi:tRNA-Thr(GGU) m(6)t(6)A37 methyltransferase TsaA
MRFDEQVPIAFFPIGRVISDYREKMETPRQGILAAGVLSQIEIFDDTRLFHALDGIEKWSHIWVVFCFDRDPHFSPKVQPPRSKQRRGVLSTRSPHRPNPIGMTVGRLVEIRGSRLILEGLDLLDKTPILDVKPYVPYADSVSDANAGWLVEEVSESGWQLKWSALALEQLEFLDDRAIRLRDAINQILEAGPNENSARRIRRKGEKGLLAYKDYRVSFIVSGQRIELIRIDSGYCQRDLDTQERLATHQQFVATFGRPALDEWLR